MSDRFWQAKIYTLVKSLNLEQVSQNTNDAAEKYFSDLNLILSTATDEIENFIVTAHQITDASDRALLRLSQLEHRLENQEAVEVSHLLSGARLSLDVNYPDYQNLKIINTVNAEGSPGNNDVDYQELFWWLWRCLPELVCQQLSQPSALLLPETAVLPDASLWSHNSLASAIAGCLVGYQRPNADPPQQPSIPHIATFSFSPIQELIKASRKMRDFWAGSWVLHYLSAKICWQLAWKYGPDSVIYPSLYGQPLIDHWALQSWDNFSIWLDSGKSKAQKRALLTAGFPNVIVILLPEAEVEAAMNTARSTLIKEWLQIGKLVFEELSHKPDKRYWTRSLQPDNPTWEQWLKNQWQTYWTALPLSPDRDFTISINESNGTLSKWKEELNKFGDLSEDSALFRPEENDFIAAVQHQKPDTDTTVNVGSWWPYIFDQLRFAADSVKNSRSWRIPTAFIPRSTISGIGPVVYPVEDFREWEKSNQQDEETKQFPQYNIHVTEGDIGRFWERHAGLFDGSEKLNATEVLKRSLHHVLTRLLYPQEEEKWQERWSGYYPDLSSGVAGWLRTSYDAHPKNIDYFQRACRDVRTIVDQWNINISQNDYLPHEQPWGIPWVDETPNHDLLNPRLLNAGWLIEEFEPEHNPKKTKQQELENLQNAIAKYFQPGKNPTDWYVIAAGDGDGMGKWLKGEKLERYQEYIPTMPAQPSKTDKKTAAVYKAFEQLIKIQKRMGPSTHNALSRALLDFSNQLVPYLTEQRYAGRLIYGGGDDVLAHTNFWEWDSWLWDIHECFRGAEDPQGEFSNIGDYWQWQGNPPKNAFEEDWLPRLQERPLFTMGSKASISFGVVIAHHSVPLAIALENLWQAEANAKEYECESYAKDAVQVRVLFGSGNILKATSRFKVFKKWRKLLHNQIAQDNSAIFEKAAQWWEQHPAPNSDAIEDWTRYFCQSLDVFKGNEKEQEEFAKILRKFLRKIYKSTEDRPQGNLDKEIQSWLKLTAFVLRDRIIECKQGEES